MKIHLNNFAIHYNKHKKHIYHPILFIIISLFIIPTIWLTVKHKTFTTICDLEYWKYFFNTLRLEVFLATLISLLGIAVSFIILHNVKKSNIENIDEFLEHLIRFLKKANNTDEIKIVTPTLYFGKTSKKNRLADKYIYIALRKFNVLSNVEIYTKKFNETFCEKSNNENFIGTILSEYSELVNFHKNLFKTRSDKPNDHNFKEKYFKEFCKLYITIKGNKRIKINKIPTDLNDTNIILFLNITQGEGLLGVFDEEDNFTLNANYIENNKSVLALKKLYENHNDQQN